MNQIEISKETIYFADVAAFFKKHRTQVWVVFFVSLICVFSALLFQRVRFEAEATFKDAEIRSEQASSSLMQKFLQGSNLDEMGALAKTLMLSKFLIEKTAKKLGMQVLIQDEGMFPRLKKNFLSEFGLCKVQESAPRFSEVNFDSRDEVLFNFIKVKDDLWRVSDGKNSLDFQLGQMVTFQEFSFTLQLPKNCHVDKFIAKVSPMESTIKSITKQFKILVRKEEKKILELKFKHPDNYLAATFLNEHIKSYKDYLLKEYQEISKEQLSYLNVRQQAIHGTLDNTLQAYSRYIKDDFQDSHFVGLSTELKSLEDKKHEYMRKLFETETKKTRLKELGLAEVGLAKEESSKMYLDLKRREKELAMDLLFDPTKQNILETRPDSFILSFLKQKTFEADETLGKLQNAAKPSQELDDLKRRKEELTLAIGKKEQLDDIYKLASLKEKILEKEYAGPSVESFRGLSLKTLDDLYLATLNEKERLSQKELKLKLILDKLQNQTLEISSLNLLTEESLDKNLLLSLSELNHKLRDKENLMSKDIERIQTKLSQDFDRLQKHLEHEYLVIEKEKEHLDHKLNLLKHSQLNQMNQQIVLLEDEQRQTLAKEFSSLEKEKSFYQGKLDEILQATKHVPEKWLKETKLQFDLSLILNMLEGVSKLAESKIIDHHLVSIESKAIDRAIIPWKPKSNYALLIALAVAFVSSVLFLAFRLKKGISSGLALTIGSLSERGFITLQSANQKNQYRKIKNMLILEKRVKALFLGKSSELFVKETAKLLEKTSEDVLIINLKIDQSGQNGLTEYLLGEQDVCPKIKGSEFDEIRLGKFHEHMPELLQNPKFLSLIQTLSKTYGKILFCSEESLNGFIAPSLSPIASHIVIELDGETLDDLYPFVNQGFQNKLCFIS